MNIKNFVLIAVLVLFIVFHLYYLYMLMKNIQDKYRNDKFKIFGLGIFMSKKYFNNEGIKYLNRVRFSVFVLSVYSFILLILLFS